MGYETSWRWILALSFFNCEQLYNIEMEGCNKWFHLKGFLDTAYVLFKKI
jgi:hypothetical protein